MSTPRPSSTLRSVLPARPLAMLSRFRPGSVPLERARAGVARSGEAAARGAPEVVATARGRIGAIVRGPAKGEAPDLVLIHGITDNATCWGPVQDALCGEARVHALDLPGHGLSDLPERPLTIAEMADWVIAYLDAAGIGRCVVVGNSLGGGVTLGVCARAPDRVGAAVSLCGVGAPFPIPMPLGLLRYRPFARAMPLLAATPRLARLTMRETWAPGFRLPDELLRGYWRAWRIEGRADYIQALMNTVDVAEPWPWLPSIRAPVHVVHGRMDRVIPFHVALAVAGRIPGARLTIHEGVGHEPQVECPERTIEALREALALLS